MVVSVFVCFSKEYTSRIGFFFFQAEDGIRDRTVTGVQTCALPILVARVAGRDIMSWSHYRARPSRKSVTTSIAACLPVRSGFLPVSGGLTGPGGPEWRGAIHDGRRLPAPLGRPRPR